MMLELIIDLGATHMQLKHSILNSQTSQKHIVFLNSYLSVIENSQVW